MLDYSTTLNYLFTRLPVYQQIGALAYKADLTNTLALCAALGNPHSKFRSVHVAGTNGKGSSSHMIAAVLQSAGYNTGLYTSPHLKEFTERIRINGKEVSKEFVVDFVGRMKPAMEEIRPSFFEVTVAMAFDYFVRKKVDIAVIEVGLGGRLDSTNVITPLVSLITNIGYDHMDILGHTLPEIAGEKAGIIKPTIPVIIGERHPETEKVFIRKATSAKAPIHFATDTVKAMRTGGSPEGKYDIHRDGNVIISSLDCELKGSYQQKNLPGVMMVIEELRKQGFRISEEAIRNGIGHVVSMTGLKGRWQQLGQRPTIVCDTGHNVAGLSEAIRQIMTTPHQKLHVVLGLVKEKDPSKILNLFPKDAQYYFCQAKIPRAMPASEIQVVANQMGLNGIVTEDVNDALQMARSKATEDDFIFVSGSTFVVAEIEGI